MTKDEFEARLLDLWATTEIPMTIAAVQLHSGIPAKQAIAHLKALMAEGRLTCHSVEGDLQWRVSGVERPTEGIRTFDEKRKYDRLQAEVAVLAERKRAAAAARKAEQDAQAAEEARAQATRREQAKAAIVKRRDDAKRLPAADDNAADEADAGLFSGAGKARDALEIARQGKRELAGDKKAPGHKSLLWSGGLSFLLGPVGWLYAGAWRESVPAAVLWLVFSAIAQKLPLFMIMPLIGIAMPLSGLVGVVYAWQFNRKGKRVKLLGEGKKRLGKGKS